MAETSTEEVEAVTTAPDYELTSPAREAAGKSRDAKKGDTVRATGVPDPSILDPEEKADAMRLEALRVANANVGFREMDELRKTATAAEEEAQKKAEAKAAPPGADPSLRPPSDQVSEAEAADVVVGEPPGPSETPTAPQPTP